MRNLKYLGIAILAIALMPTVASARSRWSVGIGIGGGYCGPSWGVGFRSGYVYDARPYSYRSWNGYYNPPIVSFAPAVVYAPTYYRPAYCPPPVYSTYSSATYYSPAVTYSSPAYYSTYTSPRYYGPSNGVTVTYSSGARPANYVTTAPQPGTTYGYSSYYRR